ncbi:MAG: hypothetical protein ACLRVU_09910 [Beduini sp.]|uniref:hypothetical protein n=1 Tax=Beduini sp. TaxID=1922300 RepID=UPI0039A3D9A9
MELLYDNLMYFENKILPYYILLYTAKGVIVINPLERNLKHLTGASHSKYVSIKNADAQYFYKQVRNKNIHLFHLINKDKYLNKCLDYKDLLILSKNMCFVELFDSLLGNPQLCLYAKASNTDIFDTAYLHFKLTENYGLYLGVIGDNESNYHFFNSIIQSIENPNKYIVKKINVSKIKFIMKEEFIEENYAFYLSKRNQND